MQLLNIQEPGEPPEHVPLEEAVGIDLGTTYSVVALSRSSKPLTLADRDGNTLIPSAVYYAPDGKIEVGQAALRRQAAGDRNVITSVKRLMGRAAADISAALSYGVASGSDGRMLRIRAGGREVTPVEVSAEILKYLKGIAERALEKEVNQAVITVPAYFDDAARLATRDAARLAGLEVLRLVNEPTAAALAYGLDKEVEGVYAVYDLGGGTFDVSLLKLEKGVFQVLATGGDAMLGGDDIDRALAEYVLSQLADPLPPEAVTALLMQARSAKETLSRKEETLLNVGKKQVILRRETLDRLIEPLLERSLAICARVLADAGVKTTYIHGVVLVGGSTRIPSLRKKVEQFFGRPPLLDAHPDEVVALGAAFQAEGLTQGSDNLLLDVTPLSLGLETMGGLVEKLIPRNTPIPASASQEFTTHQDGQTGMQFHIVQGERELVWQNRSLARFELSGIPPMPAGMARVQVTFTVDADGLLTAAAESTTGASQRVSVIPSYGLLPEEIERMLTESMEYARRDITERLLVETRLSAESAAREIAQALEQNPDLADGDETRAIRGQMASLARAAKQSSRERIDAELLALHRLAEGLLQRRMDRLLTAALKGKHVDEVRV